ncbi:MULTISPECIES: hypothetical protein [unclassified Streptomyces]|uniref:hypothetical protein n=1 Tax=unclassified Streptomyces TaxID=2593676 RepID=UPI001928F991|nr:MULTISPECIES: hypothetical protein [unclassified Streptomyces]
MEPLELVEPVELLGPLELLESLDPLELSPLVAWPVFPALPPVLHIRRLGFMRPPSVRGSRPS